MPDLENLVAFYAFMESDLHSEDRDSCRCSYHWQDPSERHTYHMIPNLLQIEERGDGKEPPPIEYDDSSRLWTRSKLAI